MRHSHVLPRRSEGSRARALILALATALALLASVAVPGPAAADTTPNDPLWEFQYGPPQVRVQGAWDRGATGRGVVVAVIDTGVDLDHPDLMDNVIPGRGFIQCGEDGCGNGDWESPAGSGHYHGTHVAGTVAAVTDNGIGVAGVAPDAKILAVRVLNSIGYGTSRDVGYGIRWAADNGADVINMSLGDSPGSQIDHLTEEDEAYLRDSVAYANDKGVVVVASAGNDFASICGTPSWYDGALCVAATQRTEAPSSFSNFATKPDRVSVAGPGGELVGVECGDLIVSTVPPGTADPSLAESCGYGGSAGSSDHLAYDEAAGTSMAAPHVAGVAALVASMGCDREDTLRILTETARKPGTDVTGVWDPQYGHGIVDATAATAAAEADCEPPSTQPLEPVADAFTDVDRAGSVLDVLANDPAGLTLLSAGGAAHGTVEVVDGRVVYTASPGASLPTDRFRYAVRDADGNVSAATATVELVGLAPPAPTTTPTTLYMHGTDEEGCTGLGNADTEACGGPFLDPSDQLDPDSVGRALPDWYNDDYVARAPHDPHWTWFVDEPVELSGTATISWWAQCNGCAQLSGSEWDISYWIDGVPIGATTVAADFGSATDELTATFDIPHVTAEESVTIKLEPVYFIPQQETVIYYDSAAACPGASEGPCDSHVVLPIVSQVEGADASGTASGDSGADQASERTPATPSRRGSEPRARALGEILQDLWQRVADGLAVALER